MSDQDLPGPAPAGAMGLGVVPQLLTSPTKAFQRLAAHPQWVGAFLLYLVIVGSSTMLRMEQDVVMQFTATESVMERMGLPDEDIDEALAALPDPENLTTKDRALHILPALGGTAVFGFLGALVFWLIAKLFGPQPNFKQALSVYWTANLVGALGYLVLALMVRLSDTVEVSLGLGGLIPGIEWGSIPHIILEVLNPFSLAMLFVLAVGCREVFRVPKNTGWTIAGTYWGLASLFAIIAQAIGSWFSGNL